MLTTKETVLHKINEMIVTELKSALETDEPTIDTSKVLMLQEIRHGINTKHSYLNEATEILTEKFETNPNVIKDAVDYDILYEIKEDLIAYIEEIIKQV